MVDKENVPDNNKHVCNTHYSSGTTLGPLRASTRLMFTVILRDTYIHRGPRHRKITSFVQCHTARKRWNHDLNADNLGQDSVWKSK